jgi:hypothetical protein
MQRILSLALLVLLATGLAYQARADVPVVCPVCSHDSYTAAHYTCPSCEYDWEEDAYSGNGAPPPRNSICPPGPGCGQPDVPCDYMLCAYPDCKGGIVWP